MVDIHVVLPLPNLSAISMAVMGLSVLVNTDQMASRCLVFFMPSGQVVVFITFFRFCFNTKRAIYSYS